MQTPKERQDLMMPWIEMTRFWSELQPPTRDELWRGAELLEFRQGDLIEIDFGLMITGTAAVEYVTANGRRSLVELLRSGDLIDMLRHERQQQGRLVALADCALIAMDMAEFERCAQVHAEIVPAYRRQLEDQNGRLRDHINDLAVKTPLERIVSVLFELRRWPGDHAERAVITALPILRKDIAAYLGVRPETLSRVLKQLVDTGLISGATGKGEIYLEDIPALRRVANGKGGLEAMGEA